MLLKRLLVTVTFGYIIGIIYGLCFKKSIALFYIFLFFLIIISRNLFRGHEKICRIKVFRYVKVLFKKPAILVMVIFSIVSNTYVFYINNEYNKFYDNVEEKIEIVGIVESEPVESEYNYKYVVKCVSQKYKNKRFLLYIKKDEKELLEYGDLIKVKGNFSIPDSRRNYKGFDYREYLKTRKIYGSIFTNSREIVVIKKNEINVVYKISNMARNSIIEKANQLLPKETGVLLSGILIGDTSDISEKTIEDFRDSSLSHILAVSGSHITYIIVGMTYFLDKGHLSKRKTNIIIIGVLVLFMGITGFSASVVRACIMGIIFLGAKIFYRKQDISTSVALSLLIVLVINPFSIFDIGLQLSYIGTIGIIVFNKNIESIILKVKIKESLAKALAVTFSAQVLLLPVLMYTFNTFSATFFISNVIALPLTGAITLLGFITILISFIISPVSKLLAILLNLLLKALMLIAELTSKIPFSNITVKTPHLLTVIFYFIFILTLNYIYSIFTEKGSKRRIHVKIIEYIKGINRKKVLVKLLLMLIIFSCFNYLYINIEKDLKINFLDVSQGDCTLVVSPKGKVVLIDGGHGEANVLLPYLLNRGITKIDYIIISHFDSDHCMGLLQVIKKLNVKTVVISKQAKETEELKKIIEAINEKKATVKVVSMGDRIVLDKYTYIDILFPGNDIKYPDLNNNSIVCRLIYNDFSCLFTGDIEEKTEKYLVGAHNCARVQSWTPTIHNS